MASSRQEPKPGDLIEIFRIGYQHWAIYVGDGYVVHLAPPSEYPGAGSSSAFSVLSSRAVVKLERLEDVVAGCRYQVNNHRDSTSRPRPVQDIIKSAREMVGEEMEYSIVSKNCEHFVTNLRYGKPCCRQVERAKHHVVGGGSAILLGVLTVAGYTIFNRRRQNQ
ncbi:PREDICTED: retinoic acid receptor responder protein 3 isoform X1 [Propithecus coquereli]|uniref:retinoic acid receptor responder protein 3 isoform X1 n=1 Tax=Propithecus coquereli TaxID=379532 RepID=UPI00063FCC9C|nr:PREDICTED: retinoic acid receptor responder protein 3 isoform X1 [Propithecus coquereli]